MSGQLPINNAVLQQVIGTGSLSGWTRAACHDELKRIQKAAAEGGLKLEEWDQMDSTLALLMVSVTCDKFAMLVRLYFTGRYGDQKFNDSANWF